MYEIIITKKEIQEQPAGKEWVTVDQELIEATGGLKDVYGYSPEIMRKELVTIEILKQTVTELNISKVIKAINNL